MARRDGIPLDVPWRELETKGWIRRIVSTRDRRARELFETLSRFLAVQIYQGYWYDLGTTAALSAVERFSTLVTGTVTLRRSS